MIALYIRPYASYLGSRSSGLHRNRNGSVVPLHDSSEFRYLAAVMQSSDARLAEADRRVKVGVGVFLLNDQNEFLMGRRKGSNGAGRPFRLLKLVLHPVLRCPCPCYTAPLSRIYVRSS